MNFFIILLHTYLFVPHLQIFCPFLSNLSSFLVQVHEKIKIDFLFSFQPDRIPPEHMSICQGPVKSKNLKQKTSNTIPPDEECLLCSTYINNCQVKLTCLNPSCELISHITCLADLFLVPGEYVPVEGSCPFCSVKLKWGDLIRKMKGCSRISEGEECSDEEGTQNRDFAEDPSWMLDCNEDLWRIFNKILFDERFAFLFLKFRT